MICEKMKKRIPKYFSQHQVGFISKIVKIFLKVFLCENNNNKKNSHKSNIIQSFVKYKTGDKKIKIEHMLISVLKWIEN